MWRWGLTLFHPLDTNIRLRLSRPNNQLVYHLVNFGNNIRSDLYSADASPRSSVCLSPELPIWIWKSYVISHKWDTILKLLSSFLGIIGQKTVFMKFVHLVNIVSHSRPSWIHFQFRLLSHHKHAVNIMISESTHKNRDQPKKVVLGPGLRWTVKT